MNKYDWLITKVVDPEGLFIVSTSSKYSLVNSDKWPLLRKKVKMSLFGGVINPFHLAEKVPAVVHAPRMGAELPELDEKAKYEPSKTDAIAIVASIELLL